MTNEKILDVLAIYDTILRDASQKHNEYYNPQIAHARTMVREIRKFVGEGRRDKAFRWLGFLQGILWCNRVYTIDAMKLHNAPALDADEIPDLEPDPAS